MPASLTIITPDRLVPSLVDGPTRALEGNSDGSSVSPFVWVAIALGALTVAGVGFAAYRRRKRQR
jgi:hypothetical protein